MFPKFHLITNFPVTVSECLSQLCIEPHQLVFIWCVYLRYEIQRLLSAVGNTIGEFDQQLINVTEFAELLLGTHKAPPVSISHSYAPFRTAHSL